MAFYESKLKEAGFKVLSMDEVPFDDVQNLSGGQV